MLASNILIQLHEGHLTKKEISGGFNIGKSFRHEELSTDLSLWLSCFLFLESENGINGIRRPPRGPEGGHDVMENGYFGLPSGFCSSY